MRLQRVFVAVTNKLIREWFCMLVLKDTNVVVVSKDTDILIMLVHSFSIVKPKSDWYMEIDQSKIVEIRKVCMYLGEDICQI